MSRVASRVRGGRKPWGADDRAQLAALYARGLSYVEIAAKLERTLGAIKQAVYKYQDRRSDRRHPGRGAHAGAGHQRRRPQAAAAVLDTFLRKPAARGDA